MWGVWCGVCGVVLGSGGGVRGVRVSMVGHNTTYNLG